MQCDFIIYFTVKKKKKDETILFFLHVYHSNIFKNYQKKK